MIRLFNTLSKKKEDLRPLQKGKVSLFVCGPTVYDLTHLGHARTYIFFDMFAKYLERTGLDATYVQNITDVDDKIIARAKEQNTSWKQLAKKYEKAYYKDAKAIQISAVSSYERATDHIKQIIQQIEALGKKDIAYQIADGIYYDISKFSGYGKLSRRGVSQAEQAVSRIDEAKGKRNKGDFCLWKFSKTGEPSWKSPWGKGRPGWHIEDTAIAESHFGTRYDIHGGAQDLIFPHHEAEIAQMEGISGKSPFVRYWLHTGFLTVKGSKMSKSKGNFVTVRDFLKDHSPRLLRFFIFKFHYRTKINYTEKEISLARTELEKIDEFIERLTSYRARKGKNLSLAKKTRENIEHALEDDFNTPQATASLFQFFSQVHRHMDKGTLSQTDKKEILTFLKDMDHIFGFLFAKKQRDTIPSSVKDLLKKRELARKEKNWQLADTIREQISQLGYEVKDTSQGMKIKKR